MRYVSLILVLTIMSFTSERNPDFKAEQMLFDRVAGAYQEKYDEVSARLRAAGVATDSFDLFIRAFKFEEDLEVWARNKDGGSFVLVKTYKFCENVGALGPKRKEGDKQIPEGIYELIKFNPESNFHLSLKVNYPNLSDSVLSDPVSPGGMIFIHGGCRTVGCIPITDEYIKELYVLSVEARASGQEEISVHLFPFRMTTENMELMRKQYRDPELIDFWEQLEPGYRYFEADRQIPNTTFLSDGRFEISAAL